MANPPRSQPPQHPKPPFPRQQQPKPGLEKEMTPRPEYAGSAYKPAGKLEGRKALVTGGDSGIGRAVAVLFAREGADVAIVYLPEEQADAQETASAVEDAGRRCVLIPGDVADSRFCEGAVQRAVDELGGLDVLINNAAFQKSQEKLEDITDEQLEKTFRTNIFGYFYMARAALKHMQAGASIINCGSVTGTRGSKNLLDYASTKGAINAFTKSLAVNLAARQIRVNCVAPGPVWTPLNVSDKSPEQIEKYGEQTELGRPAQPEEIAPAFVFFASNGDSSFVTGETMLLLGGEIVS
jgi:NAD(P)-dependent dehydrogenase (short-subunit alcohol dehydrogenase family)